MATLNKQKVWQAIAFLTCVAVLWFHLDDFGASEFTGGWLTGKSELPIGFGGPLRLRVMRQLGYKSVKYITQITVTDNIKQFGKGLGSASPEAGYAWYAGI